MDSVERKCLRLHFISVLVVVVNVKVVMVAVVVV